MNRRERSEPVLPPAEEAVAASLETPLLPEFDGKENVQVVAHPFGEGWVREYVDEKKKFSPAYLASWLRFSGEVQVVPELEYLTPEGKSFRFSSILPEGVGIVKVKDMREFIGGRKFVFYGKWTTVWEILHSPGAEGKAQGKTVELFQAKETLFDFLHEIGHTHQDDSMWNRFLDKAMSKGWIPRNEEGYLRRTLQIERDAWAYALRTLRRLRREGIDLAPGLTDQKLLLDIHISLRTYEEWLQGEGSDVLRTKIAQAIASGDAGPLQKEAIRPRRELKKET